MKKVLLSCGSLLLLASSNVATAQVWSQNFNSGIPANWTMITDGKTPASQLGTAAVAKLTAGAWGTAARSATDSCMMTTSYFTPTGQADRWLISQSFAVTSTSMYLTWEDYAADANYSDSMQILVSPTAGTTAASFTASVYNAKGGNGTFVKHAVSLAAYSGQTIRVAFRDHSYDEFVLYMDNAATVVLPATDVAITGVTPSSTSPVAYGLANTPVTLAGVLTNLGASPLTSVTIKYQQGSGAVVSDVRTGLNIPTFGTYSFNISTPFTIPSVGNFPIKVWAEATGDVNHSNDSGATAVNGVSFFPHKKILAEEATGTWCGWCVRGLVYMDSIWKTHADNFSLSAVHNADPMVLSAYDTWIGTKISGYPSIVIDRREVKDPSDLFTVYNTENNYFGFADVSLGKATVSGTAVTLPVTVKPAIDLSGDYRLGLILTEDRVHSTAGGQWDQHNYYSSASQNLPLVGAGFNFQQQPAIIPSSLVYYDFVGRALVGGISGTAGSLPATMTANSTYSYTFNTTLDASWNKKEVRGIVVLIRNSDGQVLNSNNTRWTLDVASIPNPASNLSVYPNPATSDASAKFELSEASNVTVNVTDALGRVVATIASEKMTAGAHQVNIPVSGMAAGLYNVSVQTEHGTVTERLSVIK